MLKKSIYFILFISAALTSSAATSYGFKVGGVEVTSNNCANIQPNGLDRGTISYDPVTNIVTLNNVMMMREGSDERVLYNVSNNGLTVRFIGSTLIRSLQAATMRFEANTTITTAFDSETETVIVGGSQEAIYVGNGCTLKFSDVYGSFYVRGTSGVPIAGSGNETIMITNADIHVKSGYNTNSDKSVISNINSLYLYNDSYMYLSGAKNMTKATINNVSHLYFQAYMGILTPSTATFSTSKKTLVDANGNAVSGNVEFSYMIPINSTTFPNAAFRNYVLDKIDDTAPSGYLNSPELSRNGYRVMVNGLDINTLQGIEFFSRFVREINCSGNRLASLTLSKAPVLNQLICSYNGLTSLNLSDCPKLESLICDYNSLTSLDVSDLPLTSLSCSHNALTTVNVGNNAHLTTLTCNNNQIKGSGLDMLINSLPTVTSSTESRKVGLVDHKSEDENECTAQQVAQARSKGWMLCHVIKKAPAENEWTPTERCVNFDLRITGQKLGSCMHSNNDYLIQGVTGSWNYDDSSNVLTLSNATITANTMAIKVGYTLPGIKIMLEGENTITFNSNSKIAILIENSDNAVIEGPGTLNINNAGSALYIDSGPGADEHRMTIRNCEINVNDPTTYSSAGTSIQDDQNSANITIENATVHMMRGSINSGYDLRLVGCKISKPVGGYIYQGSICAPNSYSYIGEIEIVPMSGMRGDVNGDGIVSGADVTALYNVLLDDAVVAGDADVNGDGVVSGSDVTALYNILLN